jgi:hypothetical protein
MVHARQPSHLIEFDMQRADKLITLGLRIVIFLGLVVILASREWLIFTGQWHAHRDLWSIISVLFLVGILFVSLIAKFGIRGLIKIIKLTIQIRRERKAKGPLEKP